MQINSSDLINMQIKLINLTTMKIREWVGEGGEVMIFSVISC